jgi:rod shape-determining protein MreD
LEKESLGTKRLLKIAGCLLIAAFAQTTLPHRIGSGLAVIDWLLLITVYVSLLREPTSALLTATAAGVLHDASSGGPALGVSGLSKVLAAYVVHQISSMIVLEHFLIRLLMVAVATVVDLSTTLVFYRILKFDLPSHLTATRSIFAAILLAVTVNLIVSLLLFPLLDRLFRTGQSRRIGRSEPFSSLKRRW